MRTIILKKNLRRKIISYYSSLPENEVGEEKKEIVKYLENNPLSIFSYSFIKKYSIDDVEAVFDHSNKMYYVMQDGKKLYFKKKWTKKWIRNAFAELSMEQDPESPHSYLSETFCLGENDVLADLGPAEGNFSLAVIDKVKKIYLIEPDKEWIRSLEVTFAPWKHKIEIIGKFVSDTDDNMHIKLDTLLAEKSDITFIKADVEGYEHKVLAGSERFFSSGVPMKISLCTYHKPDDESVFMKILGDNGFSVTPSRGYMIPFNDKKLKKPWLRRGLIRAVR